MGWGRRAAVPDPSAGAVSEEAPTMTNPTLVRTVKIVREEQADLLPGITVERAAVGLFFTGVKLSTDQAACAVARSCPDQGAAACEYAPEASCHRAGAGWVADVARHADHMGWL